MAKLIGALACSMMGSLRDWTELVEAMSPLAWPIVTLLVLFWLRSRVRYYRQQRWTAPTPLGSDEVELIFDIACHPWRGRRHTLVKLAEGETKRVDQIHCGDRLGEHTVVCIRHGWKS